MGSLAYVAVVDNRNEFLDDVRRMGDAASKALATGDKSDFRLELERASKAANEMTKALSPLNKASEAFERAWQGVSAAVKSGAMSQGAAVKVLRDLEAAMKAQLGSASKVEAGYSGLERVMKGVTAEAKALSTAQRGVTYPTAEVTKYAAALKGITDTRKAGLAADRDALAQLKSLQGAMAEYAGTLQKGSGELTALNRVMAATGGEARKLEAQQDRLEQAFRADYLKLYAGELKNIDARVRDIGFDAASREVEKLTADLRGQQGQLAKTGGEYDQLSRLLQSAAAQQERYQKAAQSAARANDAAELRTYTNELKQLTAGLVSAARQYGQLDSQQRALKYDPSGIRTYRSETEQLARSQQDSVGASSRVGSGLAELKGRLEAAAQSAGTGSQRYAELERLLQGVERATVSAAQAQERSQQAYRSADLAQFVTRLRDIETAQRAGVTTADQAARAVSQLQGEYKTYVASLGLAGRELGLVAGAQRDVATGAGALATAQERAVRSFDTAALRSFVGELQTLVRERRDGGSASDEMARKVESLQGRIREYGNTAQLTAREQADLNRVLELSDRALTDLGTAAERASRGFDGAPLRNYRTDLLAVEAAQRDLAQSVGVLEQAQRRSQDAFKGAELDRFRGELEAVGRALRDGSGDFDVLLRAAQSTQRGLQDYLGTLDKSAAEHAELSRALDLSGNALRDLETSAGRAGQAFDSRLIGEFTSELERLDAAQKDLGNGLTDLSQASDRLSQSFDGARLQDFRGEIERLITAQRDGRATFDETGRAVQDVQTRFRDYVATLSTTAREQETLNRALTGVDTALTNVGRAAQDASRGFDAAPVRAYVGELERLQGTGRELGTAFGTVDDELERLDAALRDSGSAANLSARELTALQNVERELEGVSGQLAGAQERMQASFKSDTLRTFRSDLEQIVTANRNGVTSFEQTARAVDALQSRMRDFGGSVSLSVREQGELARVMGATETAVTKLATAQGRAQDSFQAESVRQQVAALNDLKLALERGDITQEQFSVSARGIGTALEQSRSALDNSTRAYDKYTTGLTRVESSLAQAEGRVRTFGVASGVTAGIGDQLQNVLYTLGPAGEAMGVAMGTAGAGMAGAATSAKLLNIALAAGLVGAVVAVAVGLVGLGKNMFALDTGLTDVAKTTGFTQTELRGLAGELQGIALATGTPVKNLLDLAGVAGSLGVTGVKNVAQFTDVVNKLAIASDIVGEEGAAQLANFINVTKDANQSVGDSANLIGNVIVALGNSLAATEKQILSAAERLGQLKTSSNASQTEILGLAGAMASVGLEAEAGNAAARIFIKLQDATRAGGAEMQAYARAAGLTAVEWQNLVKRSPTEAFVALTGGLKGTSDAGGDLLPILEGLGITASQERDVLLRLVGGYETLELSMKTAAGEAERMTAMNKELQTRLESLSGITSQIGQVFRFAFDSLALAAIPALKNTLTGVLDFSRGILGLEQTGDRVDTFATRAGTAIGQFGKALVTGKSEADTFAAGLGTGLGKAVDVVTSSIGLVAQGVSIGLKGAFSAGLTQVGGFISGITQTFSIGSGAISTIFTNIGQAVQNSVQFIGGVLGRIPAYYQAVVNSSQQLSNGVEAAFKGVGQILTGVGFIVYGAVVQPFVEMVAPITGAAQRVLDVVFGWVGKLGKFFEPVINLARSVGVAIGDFFGAAAEKTREGLNRTVTEGLGTYTAGVTKFNDQNKSLVRGAELIATGYSTAAVGITSATGALTGELERGQTALKNSVDDAGDMTAANEGLAEASVAAAEGASALPAPIEAAGEAVGVATGATGEYAEKLREMGPLLTSLQGSFQKTKLKLEFENDPAAAIASAQTIATKAGAAAQEALAQGKPARAEALLGLRDEAQAFILELVTGTAQGTDEVTAEFTQMYGSAQDAAATWSAVVIAANRDVGASVVSATTPLFNYSDATGRAYGETEKLRIAQINATNVGQSYVDNIIRTSQAYGERVTAERAAYTSALSLQYAQQGLADVSTYTADQYRLVGEATRTTGTALQEAANRFQATGDATQFNADKTEIYRSALETLYRAGIDPATVGLGRWVTALGEATDKQRAAEEGAKRYETNLEAVRGAQEQLKDTTSLTAAEALKMADGLAKAATGAGELGVQARAARQELLEFAAAKAVLKQTTAELELVGFALSELSKFASSQGADQGFVAVLAGIGGAATEAAVQIENFSGSTQDKLGAAGAVVGVFADIVRQAFGEDIPAEVNIGLSAIETGLQGAMSGFAVGGPLGAAIGAGLGLVLGFFTASAEEANKAAAEEEQRQKEAAEAHAEFIESWKERERERIESIREGQAELNSIYAEMRQSSADLSRDLNDARLDNARASGADEAVIFISETILALRDASAQFGAEMQRITQEKEQFILAYLQANPGAGRGEAEAAAEAIFGPQREALKEQFALTGETILLEAEKTAKDLGLSQQEFYEAVFAGNTELLGTMTEGQRQALIQFVEVAREMGVELPSALTEAYDNINSAENSGAETVIQSLEAQRNVLQSSYDQLKSDWKDRSQELREQIKEAKGQEKADLQAQYEEEKTAYQTRADGLSGEIKGYNEKIAQAERDGGEARNNQAAEMAQANVDRIQAAYDAENEAFKTKSNELQVAIAESKGAEREAYQRELDLLTAEHARAVDGFETELARGYDALEEAERSGSEDLQNANQASIDALNADKEGYQAAWQERSRYLMDMIAKSTGETQQMYIEMLRAEGEAYKQGLAERNTAITSATEEGTQVDIEALQKRRDKLREAYRADMAALDEQLKTATGAEREALLTRQRDLTIAFNESDDALETAINEGNDGMGSALEASAQENVGFIERDIATLNSAWAKRSEELKNLIATSTGTAKAEYERMYREESAAYTTARDQLSADLTQANQDLLDAQDKGAEDFAAAQQEVGRKEQEALGGVFEILRKLLGEDADLIIELIQTTYDKRRAAYLAEGQATADAAGQANQSEVDQLNKVFEILRSVLGPDADVIISMIQGTYDKRAAAYNTGGQNAANAAVASAESERQSVANINQVLRDLFGPEAQGIIDQILALYKKREDAYRSGGEGAGAAATAAGESERQSVANINQLLRDIFGPEAQGIIDQILGLYKKREDAYAQGGSSAGAAAQQGGAAEGQGAAEGGQAAADGINQGTETTTGALEQRKATIESFLARGDVTPALRTSLEALDKAFREGGNLTAAEIAANRETVTNAINERGAKIQALVQSGVPLADAVRQVDTELARTFDQMGAEVAGSATSSGQVAAQGVSNSQQSQLAAIEALKSGLVTSAGGISGKVTPAIVEEHRRLMEAFIQGAQTSGGGISDAERVQIEKMSQYQAQLEGGAGKLATGATPAITAAHKQMLDAFIQGAQASGGGIDDAERLQIEKMQAYQTDLTNQAGGLTTGVTPAVSAAHQAIAGAFLTGGELAKGGVVTSGTVITAALGLRAGSLTGAIGKEATLTPQVQTQASQLAGAFVQGGQTSAAGVSSSGIVIRDAIASREGTLKTSVLGGYAALVSVQGQGSSQHVAAIQRAAQQEAAQFQAQSSVLLQRISTSKGAERERLINEYQQLKDQHDAKSQQFTAAIQAGGTREASILTTVGGSKLSAIIGASQKLVGGIKTGYDQQVTAQGSGSSQYVAKLQQSYAAEQSKFASESAEMQRRIAESKGSERDKLISEYQAMQREHAAKSADYQRAIADAGSGEKGKVGDAARLVSGALGDMGDDEKTAAYNAYDATKREHDRMSALYRALMGDSATDERAAAIKAAVTTGGGLTTMGGNISGSTTSAFGVAKAAYERESDLYQKKIKSESDDVKTALERAAALIKNFKFPALPKPPSTSTSGDPGPYGLSTSSFTGTPMSELGSMAAFAADGIPDYAGATMGMQAYAAAASPLLDLFGGRETLRLTTSQERSLSIDLRFGGSDFAKMFERPIGILDQAANLMWESQKLNARTVAEFRDAVEDFGTAARSKEAGTSMYDLSRGKKRRV